MPRAGLRCGSHNRRVPPLTVGACLDSSRESRPTGQQVRFECSSVALAVSQVSPETPSAEAIRSISPSTHFKFRSFEFCVLSGSSHVRSRLSFRRWRTDNRIPWSSRSRHPMFVINPLSCICCVVGNPTRETVAPCSKSSVRHSGPRSIVCSETTSPHSEQTVSSVSLSRMSCPEHSGHTSCFCASRRLPNRELSGDSDRMEGV